MTLSWYTVRGRHEPAVQRSQEAVGARQSRFRQGESRTGVGLASAERRLRSSKGADGMRLRNTNPTAVRSVPFTLVELLTVMLIMGILLAVTVPAVIKITSGSSVEAASRMVGSQLRLARQEAITKRKTIAVLFPTASTATDPVAYVGFRPCIVERATSGTADYTWLGWVQNTTWSFVPVGAVLAEVDQDGTRSTGGAVPVPPVDNTITTVGSVPGFAADTRAIVFKPSGQIGASLQRFVTLVEGAVPTGSATPVIKNRTNWIDINVNQFTGRVTYQRLGE